MIAFTLRIKLKHFRQADFAIAEKSLPAPGANDVR